MAADRVKFAVGRTINLDNYESLRVDVGLEADVRPNEDRQTQYNRLQKQATEMLDGYCLPIEKDIAAYNRRRKGK